MPRSGVYKFLHRWKKKRLCCTKSQTIAVAGMKPFGVGAHSPVFLVPRKYISIHWIHPPRWDVGRRMLKWDQKIMIKDVLYATLQKKLKNHKDDSCKLLTWRELCSAGLKSNIQQQLNPPQPNDTITQGCAITERSPRSSEANHLHKIEIDGTAVSACIFRLTESVTHRTLRLLPNQHTTSLLHTSMTTTTSSSKDFCELAECVGLRTIEYMLLFSFFFFFPVVLVSFSLQAQACSFSRSTFISLTAALNS